MINGQDKAIVDNRINQLRELHGSSGIPIDETMRWSFVQTCEGKSSLSVLTAIPPTAEPSPSSRLLFVGTNVDCRYLYCLGQKENGQITLFNQSTVQVPADVCLASRGESFWKAFFNTDRFCDAPVSKPALILTTDRIRDYDNGGTTVDGVLPYLKKIGEHFGVPVKYIEAQNLKLIAETAYQDRMKELK